MGIKKLIGAIAFCSVASLMAMNIAGCSSEKENPSDIYEPDYVDVFIFMGQSNMAGRADPGEGKDAIPCAEGHGYEFRAVSGSDEEGWLYPIEEPFGNMENNDALKDGGIPEGKKVGGMVSSFCESYYQATEVPVVAVSASVAGTSIELWTPGTSYFEESKRRLQACVDYLDNESDMVIRNINMVWCQGESDASRVSSGSMDYAAKLQSIVDELKPVGVEHCFILPPSEYTNGNIVNSKTKVVELQMKMCAEREDFVLGTLKFRNVPLSLRNDPHFHQGLYNVAGWDAGANAAQFIMTGDEPVCTEYVLGEEIELAELFNIDLKYKSTDNLN